MCDDGFFVTAYARFRVEVAAVVFVLCSCDRRTLSLAVAAVLAVFRSTPSNCVEKSVISPRLVVLFWSVMSPGVALGSSDFVAALVDMSRVSAFSG